MHNIADAIKFCKTMEDSLNKSPIEGHIALTGGCLYKEGDRKDIDVVLYSENLEKGVNQVEFFKLLIDMGCYALQFYGRVTKVKWKECSIDIIQPEVSGVYKENTEAIL